MFQRNSLLRDGSLSLLTDLYIRPWQIDRSLAVFLSYLRVVSLTRGNFYWVVVMFNNSLLYTLFTTVFWTESFFLTERWAVSGCETFFRGRENLMFLLSFDLDLSLSSSLLTDVPAIEGLKDPVLGRVAAS